MTTFGASKGLPLHHGECCGLMWQTKSEYDEHRKQAHGRVIEVEEYNEAKRVLRGGTAPVVAHGMGWLDDEWQRVVEVKASQGAWFARFFASSEKWTQIDGLEVRK